MIKILDKDEECIFKNLTWSAWKRESFWYILFQAYG